MIGCEALTKVALSKERVNGLLSLHEGFFTLYELLICSHSSG